jgi:abequosyltransferase
MVSKKNELLAICIPTYNHAEPLKRCLAAMIPQARQLNISIYVSDNASTDKTMKALESFQKTYPFLYYQSNEKNLGVDKNIVMAARMASTKYVWTFGSRRILLPGMLNKIYKKLSESSYDLIVLNDENLIFLVPKSQEYNSAERVFRELNRNLSGVGFQILPSEAWKPESVFKYDGTEWTVFGVALDFIATKPKLKAYFISEPCSTASGTSHWHTRYFQIWANWKKVIRSLPETYSDEDKDLVIRNSARFLFVSEFNFLEIRSKFTLTDLRIRNIYNTDVFNTYREDLAQYGHFSPNIAYAIAKFPIPLLKLYYRIYDAIRQTARIFLHGTRPLNPTTKRAVSYE